MKRAYLLLLLLLIPFKCNASCTVEEQKNFTTLGTNVNYTYDLVMKDGVAFYNVKILNLVEGMRIKVNYNFYDYNGTSELNIGNFVYSSKAVVKIYACDTVIKSFSINVPGFNKYATDSLCEGIENYKLCSKWTTQNIDYDTFKKEVLAYRESLKKSPIKKDNDTVSDILNNIVMFFINYNVYIMPFIIVGGITGIIIIKRDEKNIIKFKI